MCALRRFRDEIERLENEPTPEERRQQMPLLSDDDDTDNDSGG